MNNIKIELTKEHRGSPKSTTFSGRLEGRQVREKLNLDNIDSGNANVTITIPNDTTSFNPSFFLGLFFDSVKKSGSVESFKRKFVFDLSNFDAELKNYINQDIDDCFRRCDNELNQITGIDL